MPRWWGECALDENRQRTLRLGPATITVRRTERSWWVHHTVEGDPRSAEFDITDGPLDDDEPATEGALYRRIVSEETIPALEILPRVPDRPLVLELEQPSLLPPAKSVVVWIHIPLWLEIRRAGDDTVLLDFPIWRPSDTFVGRFVSGDLCYAGRTRARRSPDPTARRAQRAIARVTVRNASKDVLELNRISVPVPRLSLWADTEGWLGTSAVTVIHRGTAEDTEVEVGDEPLPGMEGATLVSPPRERHTGRFHARVLADLFR